jgi:hypothetical protein
MKTIALIDTGSEVPGVSLEILVSGQRHREGGLRCQGRFPEGRGFRWSYPDQDCHAERPARRRSTRSAGAPGRKQMNYRHLKEGGRRA